MAPPIMTQRGPVRPFTERENQIADLIRQGKSYAQIGRALSPRISAATVRTRVKMMAYLFDAYHELDEACPPRQIILVYAIYRHIQRETTDATRVA